MASLNGEEDVSPDIHICGFCKQQYNNFKLFLAHKQKGCQIPSTLMSPKNAGADVKKNLTKAQKSPSKKLKHALTQKRHMCTFSGCSFKTQYGQKDMERHILTHTGERPFECELCHKRFSRRDKLNLHSRLHTGEKPHKCKYCPYAAADSSSLKKHLRIHYDERPFKCQICPYASRNSSQLTVHLRSHTGDAPFQCNQCDAKFKINHDLKRHSRVHSGEKPYKCDLCEYRCAVKANLKPHIQLNHGVVNSFRCTECEFQCSTKATLRDHSRQHQPTQPLQCSKCIYSCSSKGALKIHERVHSDERPFKCEHCSFASKQRSNLLIHRRKSHADRPGRQNKSGRGGGAGEESAKPLRSRYRVRLEVRQAFRCDLCEASFVREDSLRIHKRQHNNNPQQRSLNQASAMLQSQSVVKQYVQDLGQASIVTDMPSTYSRTHLNIIVAPSIGPEDNFVQASVDVPTAKVGTVLLSPEDHNMLLNPAIQHVSMLTPVQHIVAPTPGCSLEHQTVLLTDESTFQTIETTSQTNGPTPNFITSCSDSASDATHTFITSCSDLESLHTLIQEGGTEVTVVTETNSSIATTKEPLNIDGTSHYVSKQAEDAMPEEPLNIDPSGLVFVQSLPLTISTQDQEANIFHLSPHHIFSDSNTVDISDDS
ncbi:zinc finger protein 64-like isoform X1 [Xyrauchen texanus]|uniref:zinc finger protein 64-like isoform X1 n=1 Tax=Xyrauchen texanus TaxID=154827 RepID=UPI0022423B81|nr:zinc finger protein 64-like isoform X1 [Xyrauchen texanus]